MPSSTARPSPTPTPTAISAEAVFDILPRQVLQLEDLPAGFAEDQSTLDSLDEEASGSEDPVGTRRLLESWGFVAGFDRSYTRDAEGGLVGLLVEVWALRDADGAEQAFISSAIASGLAESVDMERITGFSTYGDRSEAFQYAGSFPVDEGQDMQLEGYAIAIRVDRFLGIVVTASLPGERTQGEADQLARIFESRLRQDRL